MVVIGFEEERYSVEESDGQVNIAVVVRSGMLSRPVTVTVTTMDSTAQCKTPIKFEQFIML